MSILTVQLVYMYNTDEIDISPSGHAYSRLQYSVCHELSMTKFTALLIIIGGCMNEEYHVLVCIDHGS